MALNEITKGMSNAAEEINDNFKSINEYTYDTGDKDLMPFVTNGYESSSDSSNKYRKVGKQVQLIFDVTNLKIGIPPYSEEAEVCFVLPEELRPSVGFSSLARTNGTAGKNPVKIKINTSGEVRIISNNTNDVKASEWVSGQVMYFTK